MYKSHEELQTQVESELKAQGYEIHKHNGEGLPDCPKHGKYEVKTVGEGSLKLTIPNCPNCAKEYGELFNKRIAELKDEQNKQILARRYEKAGVGKRYIGAELTASPQAGEQQAILVKRLLEVLNALKSNTEAKSQLVTGGVGTGKTYLASALVKSVIDAGKSAKIAKVTEITRSIKDGWKTKGQTEGEIIDRLSNWDLLVIDELGIQFDSEMERIYLSDIVDNRYKEMRPTIFLSNFDVERLKPILGQRLIDRIAQTSEITGLNYPSLRTKTGE